MKRALIYLILFIQVGILFGKSPFTIVQMNENQIILDFKLPEYKLEQSDNEHKEFKKISIADAFYLTEEGLPLLPGFSEQIGIPIDGEISLELISKKEITLNNISIIPAQKMDYDQANMTSKFSFFKNENEYRKSRIYPVTQLKKNSTYFISDRRISGFQFFPFRHNTGTKSLIITESARIKIIITGNQKTVKGRNISQSIADQFGDDFVINNQYSKDWRKERTPINRSNQGSPKSLTQISEIQFLVKEAGIYKVSYDDLADSMEVMKDSLKVKLSYKLNEIDPRYLELCDENGPVPINFVGENDGHFNSGDYFEFYGEELHGSTSYYNNYSRENVYTLKLKNGMGTRMAVENGGLQVTNQTEYIAPEFFEETLHFENQAFADRLGHQIKQQSSQGLPLKYDREDLLFWKSITAPDLNTTPFTLEFPDNANTKFFTIKAGLFGSSYKEDLNNNMYDHHAIVRVNSALINNHWWRGQKEMLFENQNATANSYLINGENTLYIDLPGDTESQYFEQVFLDYFEIKYWREYKTNKNELKFSKPSNRPFGTYQFEIKNISTEDVSLYKIGSSIVNNYTVKPFNENGSAPYSIIFQDQIVTDGVEYYLVSNDKKKKPISVRPNYPSDLLNTDNSAELIILTGRKFVDDPGTLLFKQTWESRNYNVEIVDVQDIYDEFNNSIINPDAIKEFLTYAYNNWQEPRLSDVLILGDGIFDKKSEEVTKKYDIVPVKNIWTYKHGATASDNWYACIVGDDPVADINISRICVYKKSQILPIAQKTVHYLNEPNYNDKWHSRITLCSGGKSGELTDDFAMQSEQIRREVIPQKYHAQRVYTFALGERTVYVGSTSKLKDNINDGVVFLQFMGHGGGQIWSDYNLLNASDIKTLSNTSYPFVSSLACFASAFDTEGLLSIGENFIAEPEKGAISHVGMSGLGYLWEDLDFGRFLSEGFFTKNLNTVGAVVSYTKAKFYGRYGEYSYAGHALTEACVLLGDPLIPIKKPIESGRVTVNENQFFASVGDTLKIKAEFDNDVYTARMYVLDNREIAKNIPYDLPVVNGVLNTTFTIPEVMGDSLLGRVKFIASTPDQECIASEIFSIGNAIASDVRIIPANPTPLDTLQIQVKFLNIQNIQEVDCVLPADFIEKSGKSIPDIDESQVSIISLDNKITLKMIYNPNTTYWELEKGISDINKLGSIHYYFKIKKSNNETVINDDNSYYLTITGADISITNAEFATKNNKPVIRVLTQNVGNEMSSTTTMNVYTITNNIKNLITSMSFAVLQPMEKRWEYFELPIMNGNFNFEISVNELGIDFVEAVLNNNVKRFNQELDLVKAGLNSVNVNSLDNNLNVQFPANLFNQDVYFNVARINVHDADNQPDIHPLMLKSGISSPAYEITSLNNEIFEDSLQIFPNNKKMILTFYYNTLDTLVQHNESQMNYTIYRWEPDYRKWISQSGLMNGSSDIVVAEIDRPGIYSIFRNTDTVMPLIDVNVEGQEFTYGGYISGNGVLSFLFNDANGIDIFDHPISMFLNGESIDPKNFAISAISGHLNQLPMKYKLNLGKGEYNLSVSCTDVNGKYSIKQFDFKVNDTFDLIKIANYPNPVKSKTNDPYNANRTRFTYSLTDDADNVKIKIYTVSGRLVKTFRELPSSVGYHEYPRTVYGWDCTDDTGMELANGVYFYKVIAKKGNKEITKTGKLAILR